MIPSLSLQTLTRHGRSWLLKSRHSYSIMFINIHSIILCYSTQVRGVFFFIQRCLWMLIVSLEGQAECWRSGDHWGRETKGWGKGNEAVALCTLLFLLNFYAMLMFCKSTKQEKRNRRRKKLVEPMFILRKIFFQLWLLFHFPIRLLNELKP